MDNESYNKALDDLRNELATKMRADNDWIPYDVQVVSWGDVENKIEELKRRDDS